MRPNEIAKVPKSIGSLQPGLSTIHLRKALTLTINHSLPFINDNGCGLAIATRTYLDAINKDGVQPTEKLKGQIKAQEDPYTWFQFVSNLSKNLDNGFKLWDAVSVDFLLLNGTL
jgi:hypothetical protein